MKYLILTLIVSLLNHGASAGNRLRPHTRSDVLKKTLRSDPTCPVPPAEDIPIFLTAAEEGAVPTAIYVSDYRAAVLFANEQQVVDTNGVARTVGANAEWIAIDVHGRDYVMRMLEGTTIVLEDIDTLDSWTLSTADGAKFFKFDMNLTVASPRWVDLLVTPTFKFAVIRSDEPEIREATLDMTGNSYAELQGIVWEGTAIWALVRIKDADDNGKLRIFNLDDLSEPHRQYDCGATVYDVVGGHGEVFALEAGKGLLGISTTIDDIFWFTRYFTDLNDPRHMEGCGTGVYVTDQDGRIQYTNREERTPFDYYAGPGYDSTITGMAMSGLDFYVTKGDAEIHLIRNTGGTVEPISTTYPDHMWGGCDSLVQMEIDLHHEVNQYRAEHGLPSVDLSVSLTETAWYHVRNQLDEDPIGAVCNLHSWLALCPIHAPCDMCCYSGYEPDCSNKKPSTITNGRFPNNGYENSFSTQGFDFPSAEYILENWKNSPGHNALILNLDSWTGWVWKSMGVALNTGDDEFYHYANLWFSDSEDPEGYCDLGGGAPGTGLPGTDPATELGTDFRTDPATGLGTDLGTDGTSTEIDVTARSDLDTHISTTTSDSMCPVAVVATVIAFVFV